MKEVTAVWVSDKDPSERTRRTNEAQERAELAQRCLPEIFALLDRQNIAFREWLDNIKERIDELDANFPNDDWIPLESIHCQQCIFTIARKPGQVAGVTRPRQAVDYANMPFSDQEEQAIKMAMVLESELNLFVAMNQRRYDTFRSVAKDIADLNGDADEYRGALDRHFLRCRKCKT